MVHGTRTSATPPPQLSARHAARGRIAPRVEYPNKAMAKGGTFVYTLIPADDSEPFEEIRMEAPAALEENIGCLTKALNDHYRRVAPVPGEAGKQRIAETIKEQIKKQQPGAQAPDEKMLEQLSCSQTVDIVQLLPSIAAHDYVGVNMYVDDKGVGKGSAVNRRASNVCTACGLPTEVRGDAFIARIRDDQVWNQHRPPPALSSCSVRATAKLAPSLCPQDDIFERMDLTTADLSSDADWVSARPHTWCTATPCTFSPRCTAESMHHVWYR